MVTYDGLIFSLDIQTCPNELTYFQSRFQLRTTASSRVDKCELVGLNFYETFRIGSEHTTKL